MNIRTNLRRLTVAAVATSCLLLSACLFTPGKFTSELLLRKGGSFSYSYDGEISMMGLSQLSKMGGDNEFEPECVDEGTLDERACSQPEMDEQRAQWERKQANDEQEQQQFSKMFGGLDPSDPESAEQLAELLRKQKGWKQVDYRGDGLFVVNFAVSGNLSHGFQFPTVERMPAVTYFIAALPRNDGSVRIDAPGFGGQATSGMGSAGAGMLAAMGASNMSNGANSTPDMVLPDGIFTIVTDGDIRANNTDEGPEELANGFQRLEWKVDSSSQAAPMALINLN